MRLLVPACFSVLLLTYTADVSSADVTPIKSVQEYSDIGSLSGGEIANAIASHKVTSEAVVSYYLKRIQQLDGKVNSIIALNPNALAEAREKDKEIGNKKKLGRLHGVPVLIKDNIETKELPTTAGSLALALNKTERDAPIVARLRAEGAIILGKTNLSEWANFRSNDSISGWSAVGGQTRNPFSLDRSPCGSSSGTGAAIASQFAPLGIGTETNGSVMCPSAMNGIVGFKPTVGLMPRTHIVPISFTQDTAGPMTRSVKDAALMLSVMAGSDSGDKASALADKNADNYVEKLDGNIKGLRIGVLRWSQGNRPAITDAFNQAVDVVKQAGASIVDIESFDAPEGLGRDELLVLETEFKHSLNAYLADAAPDVKYRSLEEVIKFNESSEREMALFDQSLMHSSQEKPPIDGKEYQDALANILTGTREKGIDLLLKEHNVDVLMMPSRPAAFLIDPVYGDNYPGGSVGAGWLAAIAGYPIITVPMGSDKGLPLGVGFMSGAWNDAQVLQVGYAYEQGSKKIMTPTFAQSGFELDATKDGLAPQ
ncbi:amidase [Alteromonas sp. 5E99-2]|uniref:amidase n=1 Tax=Alteromonas sp. 5E99-2 TaxID=2817683 RepID=UPI001F6033EF|nr:amidase [Alteromonas sp. 5E99-2]